MLLAGCAASTPDKWERLDGRRADEGTVKIAIGNCQDTPDGGVEECMKRILAGARGYLDHITALAAVCRAPCGRVD